MTSLRRQIIHRVTPSRSAKRKSPTSAWRHSTSSTRRIPRRLKAVFNWRAAAAAAEVAEAAEAAVAEAAAAVGDVAVAAAVAACRGELAASARPERFPIALTNTGHHGRARYNRPGQSMSSLQCSGRPQARMTAELAQYCREMPARELDEGFPVIGEYALHGRTRMLGNAPVLTS
jgi:hypothetical protein